jgi:FkbM family methyltransferase
MQRFTAGESILMEKKIFFSDALSYVSSVDEILSGEIYKFKPGHEGELVIIDCGANIGISTIFFKLRYPNSKIYSYEPDPFIFNCLEQNIASFGFRGIHLNNLAIANKYGEMSFISEGGHSGMLSDDDMNTSLKVKTEPLNNILDKFDKVDFLKIDIEGFEINLFKNYILKLDKVEKMFIEYHSFLGQDQDLSLILSIIEKSGFRYYIKEAANKKSPFMERELFYKMDMLVNIFCYRD